MQYAKLGNTNIKVSKLCVGYMSFGKAGTMHDWTVDENATEIIVKHALDLGINFFGLSEKRGIRKKWLNTFLNQSVSTIFFG